VVVVGFMALSRILSGGKVQRAKPPDPNKKISENASPFCLLLFLGVVKWTSCFCWNTLYIQLFYNSLLLFISSMTWDFAKPPDPNNKTPSRIFPLVCFFCFSFSYTQNCLFFFFFFFFFIFFFELFWIICFGTSVLFPSCWWWWVGTGGELVG
jgi:hypothetical protein